MRNNLDKLLSTCAGLGLLLFTSSCEDKCPGCDAGYGAIISYSKKAEKKDRLYLAGLGGSFPDEKTVKKLNLTYQTYDKYLSINQARELIVNGIEEFLKNANEDIKLKPFLESIPFTHHNLEYGVLFLDKEGTFVSESYIADAVLNTESGRLVFSIYDKNTDRLKTIHSEKYEDALKIVQSQKLQSPTPQAPISQSI